MISPSSALHRMHRGALRLIAAIRDATQAHRLASTVVFVALCLVGYLITTSLAVRAARHAHAQEKVYFSKLPNNFFLWDESPHSSDLAAGVVFRDAALNWESWINTTFPILLAVLIGCVVGIRVALLIRLRMIELCAFQGRWKVAREVNASIVGVASVALGACAAAEFLARSRIWWYHMSAAWIDDLHPPAQLWIRAALPLAAAVALGIVSLALLFQPRACPQQSSSASANPSAASRVPSGSTADSDGSPRRVRRRTARSRLRVIGVLIASLGIGMIATAFLWKIRGQVPDARYGIEVDSAADDWRFQQREQMKVVGIIIIGFGLSFAVAAPMLVQLRRRNRRLAIRGCCQRCGSQLDPAALSCGDCGELVSCAYCLHPLAPTQPICVECGKPRLQPMAQHSR